MAEQICALCGLKIDGPAVVQTIAGQEQRFCCQGCARVYQLASDTGTLAQVLERSRGKPPLGAAKPAKGGQVASFVVQGMSCEGCLKTVTTTLRKQKGVLAVELGLQTGQGELRYEPGKADLDKAFRALDDLGYPTRLAK